MKYIRGGMTVMIGSEDIKLGKELMEYMASKEGVSLAKARPMTLEELGDRAIEDEDYFKMLKRLWWVCRLGGKKKVDEYIARGISYPQPVCYQNKQEVSCPKDAYYEGICWAVQRQYMRVSCALNKPWCKR